MRSPTDRAPYRVLVKGATRATDPGFPVVLERELLASGRNAVVRDATAPAERVAAGIRNWEAQVFPWSPDVVVLDYAHHEALRRRTKRLADDLERLVRRIIYISNPLVLLPEPSGPGRGAPVRDALAAVVTRIDRDNVRVFAPADDALGRALAREIGPWCDEHVPVWLTRTAATPRPSPCSRP